MTLSEKQINIFKKRANNIINNSKQDFKKLNYNLKLETAFNLSASLS